jgi:hypothetical protein
LNDLSGFTAEAVAFGYFLSRVVRSVTNDYDINIAVFSTDENAFQYFTTGLCSSSGGINGNCKKCLTICLIILIMIF